MLEQTGNYPYLAKELSLALLVAHAAVLLVYELYRAFVRPERRRAARIAISIFLLIIWIPICLGEVLYYTIEFRDLVLGQPISPTDQPFLERDSPNEV